MSSENNEDSNSDEDNENESASHCKEQCRSMLMIPQEQQNRFRTTQNRSIKYETSWRYRIGDETFYVLCPSDYNKTLGKFCMNFFPRGSNFEIVNHKLKQTDSLIAIEDIKNHKHQNLLIYAAINNRIEIIKKLLTFNFDIDFEDDDHLSAIDYAWINYINQKNVAKQKEINEIILFLLNSNSKFPKEELKFNYENASEEVKMFINNCEEMHRLIENDDVKSVQSLIEENCDLRYFYDRFNESAMLYALKRNRIKIINEVTTALSINKNENLSEIYEDLDFATDEACLINHYILVLNSISKFVKNTTKNQECWTLINEAYESLDKISICSKILKIVATCKKLWIIFDFSGVSSYAWKKYDIKPDGSITIHVNAKIGNKNEKFATVCSLIQKLYHLAIKIACLDPNADETVPSIDINGNQKLTEDGIFIEKVQEVFKAYSKRSNSFDIFNYLEASDVVKVQQALKYLHDPENIIEWNDLIEPMKERILASKIIFQGEETSLNDMIGDDSEVLKFMSADSIQEILLRNRKITIGEPHQCCNFIERKFVIYDSRTFDNLAELGIKPDDKNTGNVSKGQSILQSIKNRFFSGFKKQDPLGKREHQNKATAADTNASQPNIMSYQQIMDIVKASKLLILADSAGSGKSAAFDDLTLKLKKSYSTHWVSLIKIRQYSKIIEEFSSNTVELTTKDVSKLFIKLLSIQSRFEAEIFKKMFKDGKVILLIDGFNEMKAKNCNFMIKIIKLIKDSTTNQLFISTRLHFVEKWPETFGLDSIYNLHPMASIENELLIIQTLKTHNFYNKSTESVKIPEDLSNFIKILEHNDNKINNPLMLEIITQLYAENVIKLSLELLNLYEAFEALYHQLELTFSEKLEHKFNWHHTRFTIDNIHQVYALKLLFKCEQIEDLAIIKNWEREKRRWTSKDIEQFGFLTLDLADDKANFKFIHKSFAEIFVANFILSFLFGTSCGIRDEEFRKTINLLNFVASGNCSKFKNIATFVWDYIKTSDHKFHQTIIEILKTDANIKRNVFEYFKKLLV